MSTPKNKSAVCGFKKDGVIYLYQFETPEHLSWARKRAKKFGFSLEELLHQGSHFPQPRKFSDDDIDRDKLQIEVTKADNFTRKCLERQAAYEGQTVEEFISLTIQRSLVCDEEEAVLSKSGKVALLGEELGSLIGCCVEPGAKGKLQPGSSESRLQPAAKLFGRLWKGRRNRNDSALLAAPECFGNRASLSARQGWCLQQTDHCGWPAYVGNLACVLFGARTSVYYQGNSCDPFGLRRTEKQHTMCYVLGGSQAWPRRVLQSSLVPLFPFLGSRSSQRCRY
jgi:hypothetical protein